MQKRQSLVSDVAAHGLHSAWPVHACGGHEAQWLISIFCYDSFADFFADAVDAAGSTEHVDQQAEMTAADEDKAKDVGKETERERDRSREHVRDRSRDRWVHPQLLLTPGALLPRES